MSIIRAPRPEGNFYLLDKAISEDSRLSWAARGLLVYLLGKPDHWKVSPAHLRAETCNSAKPTGRDGIYGLLDELIKAGYVKREQPRSESGVLGEVTYIVSESPLPASPYPAEPLPARPLPANPTLVSIEDKQVLKEQVSTETPSVSFDRFWKLYPRKTKRKDALKVWEKIAPSPDLVQTILAALAKWATCRDWTKEGGRYVPHPTVWLNGERWNDELPAGTAPAQSHHTDLNTIDLLDGLELQPDGTFRIAGTPQ